jgi:hypothetical protein
MMDQYISEKELIPPGHLTEIAYSDFAADPVFMLQTIYEKLDLGDFDVCKGRFMDFAKTKKDYGVLKHELNAQEIESVNQHWSRFIRYWNYPVKA